MMGIKITGLWVYHEGWDPGDVVVLAEVGGKWVEMLRESLPTPFSRVLQERGLHLKVERSDAVRSGQRE
ncbi:MAG TPA: hypothetical protein VIJ28_21735 [Chloroflexota bacterium]|jgi:hypothetical protein